MRDATDRQIDRLDHEQDILDQDAERRRLREHRHAPLRDRPRVGHPAAHRAQPVLRSHSRFECSCGSAVVGSSIVGDSPFKAASTGLWYRAFFVYCPHCEILLQATFLHDHAAGCTTDQLVSKFRIRDQSVIDRLLAQHPEAAEVTE